MKEGQRQPTGGAARQHGEPAVASGQCKDVLLEIGIIPTSGAPPFDVVGDVHGCFDELTRLLGRLGYDRQGDGFAHPMGRRLVFVGDLVDRGPKNLDVLRAVLAMRAEGTALTVLGNHDVKLQRWLRGDHVRMTYGIALTVSEILAVPEGEREGFTRRVTDLLDRTPGYLLLDAGRLVVTHGGIRDDMIGRWDDEVRAYGLFGEVEGTNAKGKPIRRDWGAMRDQRFALDDVSPYIVYGHNPVRSARWQNRTLDLDTGCVYGGKLSALRYPEMEIVQVAAARTYFSR